MTKLHAQRLTGYNPRILGGEKFNPQSSYESLANILEVKPTPYQWLTSITGFPVTGKTVDKLSGLSSPLEDVDRLAVLMRYAFEIRKHVQESAF